MTQMKRILFLIISCLLLYTLPVFALEAAPTPTSLHSTFSTQEINVKINHNNKNIVGTWTLPQNAHGKLPTVILFHGFSIDRNGPGNILKNTATQLAEQGYAALRIDFLGSGESDGQWCDTTLTGQIADAETTLHYVKMQKFVDDKRIGILGISQGGVVSSCLAGRNNGMIKSLVLWSTPSSLPFTYSNLLGMDTILRGLKSNGEAIHISLPWLETDLKTGFFEDIYKIDPVAEIKNYSGPLEVVVGLQDPIIYPQPQSANLFFAYHNKKAKERLITVNEDHLLGVTNEKDQQSVTLVISEAVKWFKETL